MCNCRKTSTCTRRAGAPTSRRPSCASPPQGYAKGQTVFILDDPDGTPWVLQAYSLIVDPNLTYEELQTLDKKLKLAPGWKYRVKVLDQDLTLHAINGIARVVQDNLEGTYNACFEEDNQTACSYKP